MEIGGKLYQKRYEKKKHKAPGSGCIWGHAGGGGSCGKHQEGRSCFASQAVGQSDMLIPLPCFVTLMFSISILL